jgi:hypothetical protein
VSRLRLAVAMLVALPLAGCGLFNPAEPEPAPAFTGPPPSYADPDATLETIALSIELQGAGNSAFNVDAYMDAFANAASGDGADVVMLFDPADVALFPNVATAWSPAREREFYGDFIARYPYAYSMAWIDLPNDPPDDNQSTPRLVYRRYEVHAHISDTDSVLIAVGLADLEFRSGSGGRWVISKWTDKVDPAIGSPPQPPAENDNRSFGWRRLDSQGS